MFDLASDDEDKALIKRAASGDDPAFTAIMRKYKSPLYHFAYRHMGDGDDAEDVVQDTFIAMHRNLARFNPKYKFSTWAFQITMNKCRDMGRKRKTRSFIQRMTPLMEVNITNMETQENPDASIDGKSRLKVVNTAISKLPQNLKAPLILCTIENMSHKQAAEILKISPKAVETRIYRARLNLSQALGSAG
ncbi:MAG: RNA polymerase subunit sigma-24 [Alphaproteobacteria bacterium]|nr:MAG: RNA polymerase subunit sigma-24 [Alphaproteobacteria bacterium]